MSFIPDIAIPDFVQLSKSPKWDPKLYQPLIYNPDIRDKSKNLKPGTLAYDDFWDEMDYYCLNGYKPKNMPRIAGRHFFYLNFCQIELLPIGGNKKIIAPPFYRDLDHWIFLEIESAFKNRHGLIFAKPRRVGLSEVGAVNAAYELTFFQNAKVGVAAGIGDKSDEFYAKLKSSLQNMNINYANGQVKMNSEEMILGYEVLENKRKSIKGINTTCRIKTMYQNPSAFEGGSYSLIIFEEIGLFMNLVEAYKATEPCFMEGSIQFGVPMLYGCVCAGTKVWDNQGRLVNIEDLKQEDGIIGFKDGKYNKEPIVWMKPPAKKECVRITTNMGTILECSTDHPILFSKRHFRKSKRIKGTNKRIVEKKVVFKEAELLVPGDQVAMVENIQIFSDRRMWNPRLVGLLIGDGSYRFNSTPILSSCDSEVHDYISKFDVVVEKEKLTKSGRLYREIRIKGITKELRELGIYGQTKLDKRLPNDIHSYCEKDICELLGGLFDADGHVAKKQINLTSSSFELMYEVKLLLQKIGVQSRVDLIKANLDNPKNKNDYYRLTICTKKGLKTFIEKITFLIKYKEENKLKLYEYANSKNEKVAKSQYTKGMNFEKVISVERIGLKEVYNLNAGDSHTYIANGIITHNTGGDIERGSKGYMTMWNDAEVYNLKRIFISADMYYPSEGKNPFFNHSTGVTDRAAAKEYILQKRKDAQKSKDGYIKHLQSFPLTIREVFYKTKGGVLDLVRLNHRLRSIQYGELTKPVRRGKLKWVDDEHTSILLQRAKNRLERCKIRLANKSKVKFVDHEDGYCYIDSDPINQKLKHLSYKPDICGIDSYDDEVINFERRAESGDVSSGCTMIYRCFSTPDLEYNKPVAYILERGSGVFNDDSFYEHSLMLNILYDTEALVESTKKHIINFFEQAGGIEYLKERPDIDGLNLDKHGNRFGIKMPAEVKIMLIKLLKLEVKEELDKYNFEGIILDLIDFGDKNSDIGMALGICLLYRGSIFEEISDGIEYRSNFDGSELIDSLSYYVDYDGNLRVQDNSFGEIDTFIPERDLTGREYEEYIRNKNQAIEQAKLETSKMNESQSKDKIESRLIEMLWNEQKEIRNRMN